MQVRLDMVKEQTRTLVPSLLQKQEQADLMMALHLLLLSGTYGTLRVFVKIARLGEKPR